MNLLFKPEAIWSSSALKKIWKIVSLVITYLVIVFYTDLVSLCIKCQLPSEDFHTKVECFSLASTVSPQSL